MFVDVRHYSIANQAGDIVLNTIIAEEVHTLIFFT